MPGQPPPTVKPTQPLPPNLQSHLETLFGTSFGGVQVHVNSNAAMQLGVRSFTTGQDIHFAPGQERHCLGHEISHVVQQSGGRAASSSIPPGEGDRLVTNGQLSGDPPIAPDPGGDGSDGG
jgi:hypothetical protein